MVVGIIVSFLLLAFGFVNCNNPCLECTQQNKVWCPQQSACLLQESQCATLSQNIMWFKSEGICNTQPVLSPDLCPEVAVKFDQRFVSPISGNMITVPVQPRLLVFDNTTTAQEYFVGGYFSYIPTNSLQKPEFFFFSQAVDKFVATLNFQPYSNVSSDHYSENASQVIQFLDLTVVGNLNIKYNLTFVVTKNNNNGTNTTCAFTPPVTFQQTPTLQDFLITLCGIGLVIWLIGTFAFVNFMLYYNKREKEEVKMKRSSSSEPLLKTESESGTDTNSQTKTKASCSGYLGLLKAEGQKCWRTLWMSDKVLLTDYGVTLYHYIWFHRMALIYISVCSFVAVVMGLPTDLLRGTNRDEIAGDFATSTIASIALDSPFNIVHFFIIIINVSLSVVFVWVLRKRSFAIVVAEEQEALQPQEFAVEIRGIPKGVVNEKMLKEHFEIVYGAENIISAHLPLAYGPLYWELDDLQKKKEKYEEQFKHTGKRPTTFEHFWQVFNPKKKLDAINFTENKIAELRQKVDFTTPSQGTGFAYVTFTDREIVRSCLKINNHSSRWDWYRRIANLFKNRENSIPKKVNPHLAATHANTLNCLKWKVAPAPVPTEIIWKNLENSKRKKTGLQSLALIFELVVLTSVLSVTMLFAFIEVFRDLYLTEIYYQFGGPTLLETIASLTVIVLPEAVAIIEEIVAPVVETVEEHAGHIHKSGWRRTVMWHTAFFELMSGLVISRIIYILIGVAVLYDADAPLNTYHYLFNKTGMDMMKYMAIKTFTVYGIKFPALCLMKIILNKIYGEFERPEFDYFDLYAQKIVVMFCVIVYGSVMPLIVPLGVMYLGITFLYDKWAIVNFHKKDTLRDTRLLFYAADIGSFYFTIAPLATLLLISKLFVHFLSLSLLIFFFTAFVAIVMLETRRWQYMNQNVKGVRKIIKVSDHTFAAVLSSTDNMGIVEEEVGGGENEDPNATELSDATLKFRAIANKTALRTKKVLLGVAKGMKEGVHPEILTTGQRTEEEVLRSSYVHPLSKPQE